MGKAIRDEAYFPASRQCHISPLASISITINFVHSRCSPINYGTSSTQARSVLRSGKGLSDTEVDIGEIHETRSRRNMCLCRAWHTVYDALGPPALKRDGFPKETKSK